jgi:fatty-acyl-CoA synthase
MKGLMMDYPLTMDRILEHARRVYPRKPIVTRLPDGSIHRYNYADLHARVKRLSKALEKLGVRSGDRVGTFAWNNYQHLELYYGIPGCGGVCHTINIRLFPEELAYVVNHAEDKVVFVDGPLVPALERVVSQIDGVQNFVVFNADRSLETKLPRVLHYEDLLSEVDEDYSWAVDEEDTAMGLCYTSGTTGHPKGVLYSHRSMYLHTMGICQGNALGLRESDVVFPVVPQFHAMAWGLPYGCALAGASMVMPGPHLQPSALADMITEQEVTVPAGVPTLWMGLYQELKSRPRDVSRVRALVVGGSAMPRALIEAYEKELGVNVLHAWGMTETSPLGTTSVLLGEHLRLPESDRWDVKAKQGYPVGGVELRVVDENGREVPKDGKAVGEIQVRGPWVAKCYYKIEPSPDHFTADGWFRTGDVATLGEDGFVGITDRTKDLVKSGGEWISSVALESALMAHPRVAEAAVIAIPDERWGERPLAAVVLARDAAPVEPEELTQLLASRFPKFWLPEKIVFVDEIPKTSVGKFDKKVLRQRYAEQKLG